MLDPAWSEADRLELAAALRQARRDAGMSGTELGRRVYMSQAKISRIENARIVPSAHDVEVILCALRVDGERQRELVSLARAANIDYEPSRLSQRVGWGVRQRELQALEAQSRVQRYFLTTMLTGLIQTAKYSRASASPMDSSLRRLSEREVEEVVRHRRQRQAIMHRADKQFTFLLSEAALRWRLLDAAGMAEQLDHLLELAELPSVSVEVLPFSARVPTGALNVFVVYDDRLARIETNSGLLVLREPSDIQYYLDLFACLEARALRGGQATDLIARRREQYRREQREQHD